MLLSSIASESDSSSSTSYLFDVRTEQFTVFRMLGDLFVWLSLAQSGFSEMALKVSCGIMFSEKLEVAPSVSKIEFRDEMHSSDVLLPSELGIELIG